MLAARPAVPLLLGPMVVAKQTLKPTGIGARIFPHFVAKEAVALCTAEPEFVGFDAHLFRQNDFSPP